MPLFLRESQDIRNPVKQCLIYKGYRWSNYFVNVMETDYFCMFLNSYKREEKKWVLKSRERAFTVIGMNIWQIRHLIITFFPLSPALSINFFYLLKQTDSEYKCVKQQALGPAKVNAYLGAKFSGCWLHDLGRLLETECYVHWGKEKIIVIVGCKWFHS